MSKKQRKNGFTLVELAIVIAVIAILIAVLVPTFTALISKANQSSDSQLVSNLNTSITSDQAINGEYDNATEAITALREDGYDLSKLTPTADGADIVYNASTHLFVYYTDDFAKLSYGEVNSGDTLVVITDGTLSRAAEASVLSNTIEYCVYSTSNVTVNTESNSYADGATIYVYTESGSSTINATNVSTVNRYGASAADEVSVAVTSYHLYGSVETLTLQKGHVELTADAVVEDLIIKSTSDTQKVTYVKGAELTNIVDENTTNTCTCVYKTSESDEGTPKSVSELCEETGVTEAITVTGVDGYGTETNPYLVTKDSYSALFENAIAGYAKLAEDVTASITIAENSDITLDLSEYTITSSANTITVASGATLTVTGNGTNGTIESTGSSSNAINNSGTLIVNGGSMDSYIAILNNADAEATINGGTITGTGGIKNLGDLTINSGTISGSYMGVQNGDSSNKTTAITTINGGTISGGTRGVIAVVETTTINGGDISSDNIAIQIQATAEINGGTITGKSAIALPDDYSGTLNMTGGTISVEGNSYYYSSKTTVNGKDYYISRSIYVSKDSKATITGGTISCSASNIDESDAIYSYGTVVISGNTQITSTNDYNEGSAYGVYMAWSNSNGSLTVSEKVTITATCDNGGVGIMYSGSTDKTIDAENPSVTILISGGTITGNVYGISGNGQNHNSYVTIEGGTITGGGVGYYHPENGTLTIFGGSITGKYAGLQVCAGKVTISGGILTATASASDISSSSDNSTSKTGDGPIDDGAALSIINRSGYGTYVADSTPSITSVIVTGGTFISASGVDAIQKYSFISGRYSEWSAAGTYVTISGETYGTYTATAE